MSNHLVVDLTSVPDKGHDSNKENDCGASTTNKTTTATATATTTTTASTTATATGSTTIFNSQQEFVEGWTLAQTLGEGAYGE